ncbi:L-type lectin-domain containing receptor kinase IX.1-like [Miscanthus floridulus]|uniref:L-type lectin-domain containing receptor kinase IX.1-like n=1 Tax=Miscanthus floridulus TaxID=154761 RepID=UPI00345AABAD
MTPVAPSNSPVALSSRDPLPPMDVLVTPPVNDHVMDTRGKRGFHLPVQRLNLHAMTLSPIQKMYHGALANPNWRDAMIEEFLALLVEFDTFQNAEYYDPSNDHVGIDVNNLVSTEYTNTTWPNTLTSNFTKMATVSYDNVTQLLAVHVKIGDKLYNVSMSVDLRNYLPQFVAVGFSAATGVISELNGQSQILSWSFSSTMEPKQQKQPQKNSTILLVSVLVPLLFLLASGAAASRAKRGRRSGGSGDSDYEEEDDRIELEKGVAASGPKRYTYRELAAATNNFAEDYKLGRGGFGSVYRGMLDVAGEERLVPVAIKMLSPESSEQGTKEFEAEVRIISRLKHRNLVPQLLGWCDSRRNGLLLVNELVAKGSLDKHLHNSESFLTWPQRYHIILGLGSALRYLHQEWEQCVVHGDIKPSNIMLDESLSTRLGDFGLARLGDHGAWWHTTKAVMGTAGYIDPEFVNTHHPSTYSDVYSFGIVLLEIVSGRCPVILLEGRAHFVLVKWMWGLYGRNAILDAADKRLRAAGDEADDRCMERVLVVGLWCAHPDQSEQPSIAQAMHVLQSEDARLPELTPQMYRTVSEFAVTGRAVDALSVQSSSSTTTMTTGGHSKLSAESASSALLRDSKELA